MREDCRFRDDEQRFGCDDAGTVQRASWNLKLQKHGRRKMLSRAEEGRAVSHIVMISELCDVGRTAKYEE